MTQDTPTEACAEHPHAYAGPGHRLCGWPYRLGFSAWRSLPEAWRSRVNRSRLLLPLKARLRNTLAVGAGRDDVYNDAYYAYVDQEAERSAPVIVDSVDQVFHPGSVIDVGCGSGALLAEFGKRGTRGKGLEYSQAGIVRCRKRGLNVLPFDIETDGGLELGCFDVAICLEVAEHLHARFAEPLTCLLGRLSSSVVFSAAVPGQGGGADHVNEQPNAYWIEKFQRQGFIHDRERDQAWRSRWRRGGASSFYSDNVMVFDRDPTSHPRTGRARDGS